MNWVAYLRGQCGCSSPDTKVLHGCFVYVEWVTFLFVRLELAGCQIIPFNTSSNNMVSKCCYGHLHVNEASSVIDATL